MLDAGAAQLRASASRVAGGCYDQSPGIHAGTSPGNVAGGRLLNHARRSTTSARHGTSPPSRLYVIVAHCEVCSVWSHCRKLDAFLATPPPNLASLQRLGPSSGLDAKP